MTKMDKLMNTPKVADEKRIDPKTNKRNHKKTKYPPHFQIRCWGVSGNKTELSIWPSKMMRGENDWRRDEGLQLGNTLIYDWSDEYRLYMKYAQNGELDKALEILGKHHPETLTWPVRFIHIPPLDTKREILA